MAVTPACDRTQLMSATWNLLQLIFSVLELGFDRDHRIQWDLCMCGRDSQGSQEGTDDSWYKTSQRDSASLLILCQCEEFWKLMLTETKFPSWAKQDPWQRRNTSFWEPGSRSLDTEATPVEKGNLPSRVCALLNVSGTWPASAEPFFTDSIRTNHLSALSYWMPFLSASAFSLLPFCSLRALQLF